MVSFPRENREKFNEGRGWNKKGRRVFARQNEYFTGRYVRLRFSSRKSFHGIDRSNGHATVKPINLQIRCKMNYWSRFLVLKEITVDAFHARSKTTRNIRTNERNESFFFFLKHTFSKFLVNNEILTIISKGKGKSYCFYSYFNFIIYFYLVNRGRSIHSEKYTKRVTPPVYLFYHLFAYGFSQQSVQEIHFQLNRFVINLNIKIILDYILLCKIVTIPLAIDTPQLIINTCWKI